ncbi:MAG: diacylglycerol kinase, diacylglycerol kinase [Microgenomates group bacterium GW2011_GWC1_38_14]|nr:MAG: hypothetical protein US02_C0008G0003 [Candidatus Levybacteria bacterium GW2011_GWA2_36_13]KKQ58518.1 MAG: diacylglycerol kinase, diacylglycerol kinase [Microgenomates group bacterium GW2011_GWC1_38_14]
MIHKEHNLIETFGFAISGIKTAIMLNRNFKIHLIFAVLVIISCFVLGLTNSEIAIIIMVISLVLGVEMINTAIEEVVDLVTKDYREEAKYAKDVSAGMVLIVAIGSFVVGLYIFLPHVLTFLK